MHISSERAQNALTAVNRGWELKEVRQLGPRAAKLKILADRNKPRQLILLWHSARDRQVNPDIARDEFALLEILSRAGLAVPRPLIVDSGAPIPFLITEYIDGETRFAPADLSAFCHQMADILTGIHRIDINRHDLSFLHDQRRRIEEWMRETTNDAYGIRAAMRAALPRFQCNDAVLLHGDFWPGNLLWRADQLAAIIDWEDAMQGDPLGDLGKSRLEMLWALGAEAMDAYTAGYEARNPGLDYSCLPFWDLWGALRLPHFANWSADADKTARMGAQYECFTRRAIAALESAQE
ncbi:MAG: phosphotransferase [Chloroflexi bacterium]|nr:phosphotransferase [Chloroflexota bacterium]